MNEEEIKEFDRWYSEWLEEMHKAMGQMEEINREEERIRGTLKIGR